MDPEPSKGVVVSVDARGALIDVAGEQFFCQVRGRFYEEPGAAQGPIAPGDFVVVSRSGEGQGRVEEILPRRTKLSRRKGSHGEHEQVMAANVDQVAIVVATAKPRLRPGFVDRLIVAAVNQRLEPFVVVNKIDLGKSDEVREMHQSLGALGYPVLVTCAVDRTGIAVLAARLAGRITVLAGHSGVGKSSLLNAIDPTFQLKTGEVSRATAKGCHVTSRASLLRVPGGGFAVDTPGVRNFELWDLEPADLDIFFTEFHPLIEKCRFRNCSHEREPDCAVRAAAERGEILRRRYDSYLRILESLRM
jgi:ribosome biogenesis GTPase